MAGMLAVLQTCHSRMYYAGIQPTLNVAQFVVFANCRIEHAARSIVIPSQRARNPPRHVWQEMAPGIPRFLGMTAYLNHQQPHHLGAIE
jgi:hypothetical protein